MNLKRAEALREQIRRAAYEEDDPEAATSLERRLNRDFAQAIANDTCEDPKLVAAEIVAITKWTFRRMN